jgi:hypothetical protein
MFPSHSCMIIRCVEASGKELGVHRDNLAEAVVQDTRIAEKLLANRTATGRGNSIYSGELSAEIALVRLRKGVGTQRRTPRPRQTTLACMSRCGEKRQSEKRRFAEHCERAGEDEATEVLESTGE